MAINNWVNLRGTFFLFVNNESHTVREEKYLVEIANFISKKSKDNMVH